MDDKNEHREIVHLVELLRLRKNAYSTTLLVLGSGAGGLFRSEKVYEIVRSFVDPHFYQLPRNRQFGECYRLLTRQPLPGFSMADIDAILASVFANVDVFAADILLAHLIQAGFFDTILTTNIDDTLEDALRSIGMKEARDFEVLDVYAGREKGSYRFKKNISCHIVKVFGRFVTGEYCMKRSGYVSQYPAIRTLLEELLSQDSLVMALDPVWDEAIYQMFTLRGGPFWYINEEELNRDTAFYQIAQTRAARYIVGPSASYQHIVSALHTQLIQLPPQLLQENVVRQPEMLLPEQDVKLVMPEQETHSSYFPILKDGQSWSLPQSERSINVFISYAYRDKVLLNSLLEHMAMLRHEGIIHEWYSHNIRAGQVSTAEVESQLHGAQIILLLVSSSFLSSEYIYRVELEQAMQLHAAEKACVIPIILRPVDWHNTIFGKLKPLPSDGRPVTKWKNRDEALLDIVQGIKIIIKHMQEHV